MPPSSVCNGDALSNNGHSVVIEGALRDYDERNIKESYVEAQNAIDRNCMPFGAVLADGNGKIIVRASNPTVASAKRGGSTNKTDCTGHAECTLLRMPEFCTLTPTERQQSTLYSSTEPCVMCAGALWWAGVGRIVYGASAKELEQQVSGPGGFDVPIRQLYSMASCNNSATNQKRIEIVGPIFEEEGLQIHRNSNVWGNSK